MPRGIAERTKEKVRTENPQHVFLFYGSFVNPIPELNLGQEKEDEEGFLFFWARSFWAFDLQILFCAKFWFVYVGFLFLLA